MRAERGVAVGAEAGLRAAVLVHGAAYGLGRARRDARDPRDPGDATAPASPARPTRHRQDERRRRCPRAGRGRRRAAPGTWPRPGRSWTPSAPVVPESSVRGSPHRVNDPAPRWSRSGAQQMMREDGRHDVVRLAHRGLRPARGRRLPRRHRDRHHGVPRRRAREAAAGGGPGGGRQDRARQDRGAGHRSRPGAAPVLRGARRGARALRVELQEAAAPDPGGSGPPDGQTTPTGPRPTTTSSPTSSCSPDRC